MLGNYLTSTFFMLAILLVILIRSCIAIKNKTSLKLCIALVVATAAYVVMDASFIACDFAGHPEPIWPIVVFIFYLSYSLLPFVWHMFARNFVGGTFKPITRNLEYIPIIILLALIIATPFTGALWSFGEGGAYIRGPLFSFYSILNLFYYIEPFAYAVVICARKKQKEEPYLIYSIFISLVPLLATFANNFIIPIYEIFPFMPFCTVVAALMSYFFMAAKEIDTTAESQQRAVEDALEVAEEAKDRAEEANKVKSRFLSNMSHDIRTPMNAIINLTDLAIKEDDINVVHEYLDKTSISCKFLLSLINDILDMTKIESDELTLNKSSLTRSEFLKTVETVINPLMEAKHINFHPELHPGEFTISVDKMRFNQIFFNLLSNAAKFTPEGGDVWFEVNNKAVEGDKLKIEFIVRDTGIGMSEEFLQRLYEPFAREHSQLNSKTQGTGLGLSIVKKLVDAMGGSITVNSKLGEGTEFIVDFDVDIVAREELTEKSPIEKHIEAGNDLTGMRILLVEDNELNTYVATTILENVGCVVTTAVNGQEALDKFSASKPFEYDAILMDVRMPIMDGLEATRRIRKMMREDATIIPIIAMTADAFDDERKQTLESGMNYHLSKPVDANQIYEILAKCKH